MHNDLKCNVYCLLARKKYIQEENTNKEGKKIQCSEDILYGSTIIYVIEHTDNARQNYIIQEARLQ